MAEVQRAVVDDTAAVEVGCVTREGAVVDAHRSQAALIVDATPIAGCIVREGAVTDIRRAPADDTTAAFRGAVLPERVLLLMFSRPALQMPPPWLLPASPLAMVMLVNVRAPPLATWKIRNLSPLLRSMVAPLPLMVIWLVTEGRPLGPSVVLFTVSRV